AGRASTHRPHPRARRPARPTVGLGTDHSHRGARRDRLRLRRRGPATSMVVPRKNEKSGEQGRRYALRFVSGKYQGGEFPLSDGEEVVVGRSSDLDMVLVEEMVSRKHAVFRLAAGVLTVEDQGSTNGTFVNGERIDKATLNEGDRVLIGTSILRVVGSDATSPTEGRKSMLENATQKAVRPRTNEPPASAEPPRMTGSLEEIPLPDLMQLFST